MIDTTAEALAVAEVYRDAELRILQRVTRLLAAGIDAPDWEQSRLARLQDIRVMVLRELAAVDARAAAAIADEIVSSYAAGGAEALADLRAALSSPRAAPANVAAVRQLSSEIVGGVASTRASTLGFVEGAVRQVISEAIGTTLARGESRRAAAQRALDAALGQGIGGVTLPSGREMGMVDYVTMAVRTGTANATRMGQAAALLENGIDLVMIQPGPRACDLCDDWARTILSLNGQSGTIVVQSMIDDGTLEIEVEDIETAIADGLEHPNCRCSRAAYIPGASDPGSLNRPAWDREGYEAQQQQRQIERQIRNWKTREAISLDSSRAAQAGEKVEQWQANMRQHLQQNPFLKRQSRREQIGRVL